MKINPIGIIHSPYKQMIGTPIQTAFSDDGEGTVEIFPKYKKGLKDLEGFSHIILIYHFHQSEGYSLSCRPFLDDVERGLFATRAPRRPNPIGLSIVRLKEIKDNILSVSSLDVLDETPHSLCKLLVHRWPPGLLYHRSGQLYVNDEACGRLNLGKGRQIN